jgi:Kef-type K+ transport system membrane component KefB
VDREQDSLRVASARLGRKAQVGGGLAMIIGVILLAGTPRAAPGAGVDVHQMALIFIAFGIFLAAAGCFARWYYLR